jgi:hypothetical protein
MDNDNTPNCSICNRPIDARGSWKLGHNAQPINDGRCCTECNDMIVVPVRIQRIYAPTKKDKR